MPAVHVAGTVKFSGIIDKGIVGQRGIKPPMAITRHQGKQVSTLYIMSHVMRTAQGSRMGDWLATLGTPTNGECAPRNALALRIYN